MRLQIEALCNAKQVHDVETTLEVLPKGLTLSYEAIFRTVREQERSAAELAGKALQWVLYGCSSIDASSICQALSVDIESATQNRVTISTILEACHNLVRYEEHSDRLVFIHDTAREFLLNKYSEQHALIYITGACLVSLQRQNTGPLAPCQSRHAQAFLDYAATHWPEHGGRLQGRPMQLRLAQYRFMVNAEAHTRWVQLLKKQFSSSNPLCEHGKNRRNSYFRKILSSTDIVSKDFGPLLTSAYYGLSDVTLCLLKTKLSKFRTNAGPALHVAAERGHIGFIALLLRLGVVSPYWVTENSHVSALHRAAKCGQNSTLVFLSRFPGSNINAATSCGMTPLLYAIDYSQPETALLLLEHPLINTTAEALSCSDDRGTVDALFLATARRLGNVVSALLKFERINVNKRSTSLEQTPLIHAASKDCCELVSKLLSHPETDLNASDVNGYTALHFAALSNCAKCCRSLLTQTNINTRIPNNDNNTPIHTALRTGQEAATSVLFGFASPRRDLNNPDSLGNTPLIIAAEMNDAGYVEYLLRRHGGNNGNNDDGVDINATNNYGTSALHWALSNSNRKIASMILQHASEAAFSSNPSTAATTNNTSIASAPAPTTTATATSTTTAPTKPHNVLDVNLQNNCGSTYIGLAAVNGFSDILSHLLSLEDIEVNLLDEYGHTALDWAIYFDQQDCAMLLRNAGGAVSRQIQVSNSDTDSLDNNNGVVVVAAESEDDNDDTSNDDDDGDDDDDDYDSDVEMLF